MRAEYLGAALRNRSASKPLNVRLAGERRLETTRLPVKP
jgi:hypothetical protein